MDIQDKVISMAAAAAGKIPELRGTQEHGRYANRVRVASPQGSSFDGREGTVVRVHRHEDGDTVFVRIQVGATHQVTLPFAPSELEVIS